VSELQGSYQVAVVGADNKVTIRPVKIGQRIGSMCVISEGVKPGERVVAEGVQRVREGMLVTPKPYQAPQEKQQSRGFSNHPVHPAGGPVADRPAAGTRLDSHV